MKQGHKGIIQKLMIALVVLAIPATEAMGMEESKEEDIDSLNTAKTSITQINEDVIMYSDEKPKSKILWTGHALEEFYFSIEKQTESKIISHQNILAFLKKILLSEQYYEMFVDRTYWDEFPAYQSAIYLFGRVENNKLPSFIFLTIKTIENKKDKELKKVPCKIHKSVLHKDKWQYPKREDILLIKKEYIYQMSWKCIDCILHSVPEEIHSKSYMTDYNNKYEEEMYKSIRENGLEFSLIRLKFSSNIKDICSLLIFYNEEQERENNEKDLSFLTDNLTKSIKIRIDN